MGYCVLNIDKSSGGESGLTAHIERKFTPDNVIHPELSSLNEELIEFPDGVENRTQAIAYRLQHAGLKRKISSNQVTTLRIILSGTHEDMMQIQNEGRIEEWCAKNINWLKDTFGQENLVSAVLHMDEKTPHIHATVIPIVTTQRVKSAKELEKRKRTYRTKQANAPRLSARDVTTRENLKKFQDTYAEAMKSFGLQRGIEGSQAKNITTREYYREQLDGTKQELDGTKQELNELTKQKSDAEENLTQIQRETKTSELKKKATEFGTNLLGDVSGLLRVGKYNSVFDENKAQKRQIFSQEQRIKELGTEVKSLKQQNTQLTAEFQSKKQFWIEEQEKKLKEQREFYEKELKRISFFFKRVLSYFPLANEFYKIDSYCHKIGLPTTEVDKLHNGKEIEYTGKLFSPLSKKVYNFSKLKMMLGKKEKDNKSSFVLLIQQIESSKWFEKLAEYIKRKSSKTRIQ